MVEKKTLIVIIAILVVAVLILFAMRVTGYGIFGAGKLKPECNDKLDNDGDNLIDMGDKGCSSRTDNDETNCGDGVCEGREVCNVCVADCGTCGPADSCSDTDGGFIPKTKGSVTGYSKGSLYSYTDECSGSILLEWYCSGTNPVSYPWSCASNSTMNDTLFVLCINGACI